MTVQIAGEGGDESQSFLHIHVPMMRRLTRQPGYTVLMGNAAATYLETNFAGGLHTYICMVWEKMKILDVSGPSMLAQEGPKKKRKEEDKEKQLINFLLHAMPITECRGQETGRTEPFFFFLMSLFSFRIMAVMMPPGTSAHTRRS